MAEMTCDDVKKFKKKKFKKWCHAQLTSPRAFIWHWLVSATSFPKLFWDSDLDFDPIWPKNNPRTVALFIIYDPPILKQQI